MTITVDSPVGSAYWAAKAAIIDLLQNNAALTNDGVIVSYQSPIQWDDVETDTGEYEAVFFDDAGTGIGPVTGQSKQENVIICASPRPGGPSLQIEEMLTIPLHIQVLKPDLDDTQHDADKRADEILFSVMSEIAQQPDLGLSSVPGFSYIRCTKALQIERRTGKLREGAGGHGASARYYLYVECRLNFDAW